MRITGRVAAGMVLVGLVGVLLSPAAGAVTLSRGGQTEYAIVQGKAPTEAEVFAGQELAAFLRRVTGAEFPLVTEGEMPAGKRGLYVGWTAFAAGKGIDTATLGAEEWVLRTVGEDVILTGGRPRGTLYAVYELLETQVGCRWLSRDAEVVPRRPDLSLPALDVKARPAFETRGVYTAAAAWKPDGPQSERGHLFLLRNKDNSQGNIWSAKYGCGEYFGSPGGCHTFYLYVDPKKWFGTHPEYFSDNGQGQRECGQGAQLCLTHPDVRRIVLEQLRVFIAKDREAYTKRGLIPPRVYDISQEDDSPHQCWCPTCKALAGREGSEAGLVVDFINAIADGIRAEYPDIRLMTFAYVHTETPPKTLRPRDNVIIRLCDLYTLSDPYRPLTHPLNGPRADLVRQWAKIAPHLAFWDYWKMGSPNWNQACPDLIAPVLQADLQFLADHRVDNLFIESEESETDQGFFALSHWLGLKLMQNPRQPVAPLIEAFMRGYFGPAAGPMQRYLEYLSGRVAAEPESLVKIHSYTRWYLDRELFVTSKRLLDEAAKACGEGSPERLRVWREQIVVDNALLNCWSKVAAGGALPFDRAAVIDHYAEMRLAITEGWRSKTIQPKLREALESELALYRNAPVLPEQFRDLPPGSVVDFTWPKFTPYRTEIRPDADAAGGKALRLTDTSPEAHKGKPAFGVYDFTRKVSGPTLSITEVPQDGKYHLYKLGRFRVTPGVKLWGHGSWVMTCDLSPAFAPADGVPEANVWDIYVSAKFAGTAYIAGSAEPNGYWMDRVLLVKPQPGKP